MPALPSTDLYFRNAMAPWIARPWYRGGLWPGASRHGPTRTAGANGFIAGDWRILIRRDSPARMREALTWRGPLAYVIDDDVAAGMVCAALPPAYRARLADFDRAFHRDLLARADVVLAASDALAHSLSAVDGLGPRLRRIDPVWRQPPADTAHFAALNQGATLRIVQLGTDSHRGALRSVAPVVVAALDRHPGASFTYFSPRCVDDALEAHPRARRLEPMTWREYQRWMAGQRFHLALYPLGQTAFDRARSASKLTEHAIVGAVGLYPAGWAPAGLLAGAGGALLAPDDPSAWGPALESAIAARGDLAQLARNAARTLACIHFGGMQQSLWSKTLSLDV